MLTTLPNKPQEFLVLEKSKSSTVTIFTTLPQFCHVATHEWLNYGPT